MNPADIPEDQWVIDYDNDPEDIRDQMELFLFKFPEVGRENITELMFEFQKFDLDRDGKLEEDQALHLLERKGTAKTLLELREMMNKMTNESEDRRINFLKWSTCYYEKSWMLLHRFTNQKAYEEAMENIQQAKNMAMKVEEEMRLAKANDEKIAKERAEQLEKEAKLTGVAGMKAFFQRKAEESREDKTLTNEQRIKQEAARRREMREAKVRQRAAEEAAKKAQDSAFCRMKAEQEMAEARAKADHDKELLDQIKKDELRQKREEFKRKHEAIFGGTPKK
uniref:EF-hand domain-containing protein n=1 Tax=Fibrocapsa japonica TaxID=94617 RepID=A0A7S2XXF2_9STRA|eukprot:CAMPEP_0113947508 /NCGR_PEP_ID=MMETSP1339-20121228/65179_1 /TAXON_ID=94617 /ORGANISM="Fibrocapsa japonica" /LENGTH=280 /DNA_ID=CAMNT_0000954149 /DNA_START=17 /DNA_END=859 /DNA_ORIENTATION=+ /assembly_acc=CAM_ASM_000762